MYLKIWAVLQNKPRALILLILGSLGIASFYTNCSRVAFHSDPEFAVSQLNAISEVEIDHGALYTRQNTVLLSFSNPNADEMYVTNDPACLNGGTWEPYQPERTWELGGHNHQVSVYVKYRWQGLTESACVKDDILHDDIPPVITPDPKAATILTTPSVQVSFTTEESGSGIDGTFCQAPGGSAVPCLGRYVASNLTDNHYSVQFSANDKAGNVSEPRAFTFTVDTTPPTVQINSAPPALTSDTSASFEFTGMDNLTGIQRYECKLDQEATYTLCYSGQTQYSNLTSGSHTFLVHAVDGAGHLSPDATHTWNIDQGQPSIEITRKPPLLTNSLEALFVFQGKDSLGQALVEYQCQVNGLDFQVCTSSEASPFAATGVRSGVNTFKVKGKSQTGIWSAEAAYSWTVDQTPPLISIVSGPKPLTNVTTATFVLSASDADSEIASVECRLDGGSYQDCKTLVHSYSGLVPDKEHVFEARATDKAGNSAVTPPYKWTIDQTPPELVIVSGPDALTNQSTATFKLKATDAHEPITYSCKLDNEADFQPCDTTVTREKIADGKRLFMAKATDAAGNTSKEKTYAWQIDTVPPLIVFTKEPSPNLTSAEQAQVGYAVTDPNGSGVSTLTCKLDDTLTVSCTDPLATLTLPQLAAGAHKFTLTATDLAKNSSTASLDFQVQKVITFDSKDNIVTIVYEDLYPRPGETVENDADYNDSVFDLKVIEVVNSENQLTQIKIDLTPVARGGGYDHGLLMVLDGIKDPVAFNDPTNLKNKTAPLFTGEGRIKVQHINPRTKAVLSTQENVSKTADLILFASTKAIFGNRNDANVVNGDAKIQAQDSVHIEIDILDPAKNPVGERTKPDLSKYRFIMHVHDTGMDIDLVNVNPENVDRLGFPYGLVVPIGWNYMEATKHVERGYPKFKQYREYLLRVVTDPTYQPAPDVLNWFNFPSTASDSGIYKR